MTKVTYEAFAYMSKYDTMEGVMSGKDQPALLQTKSDYFAKEGYTFIGAATVTVEMESPDAIVQGQIEALNAELQKERAESQQRQNAILDQISKLSCLTNEVAA